ncbi:MAG TPA: phage terminase large subunit [Dongiaceae bacterium]|nr:phage terminase large subunit [Dongiaceae bacterium]
MKQQSSTRKSTTKTSSNLRKHWSRQKFQLEDVKMEEATRSFKAFVMQAWHVLEPYTKFVDGIHIDAICEHLQAVTEGRIDNLIINVPPGHAKSLTTAVFWPAWAWIDHPETRWLFSSYREQLAVRDSLKCRRLIESDWYQQRWGDRFQLRRDQNEKHRFENNKTGYRVVVPMFAGTGERGDYVVVDDPHSVDQAASDTERTKAVEWWNGSMSTRLNDPAKGHKVVIQQRLHESDLTGDLLARGEYEHLCLQAEFEPDRRCRTSIGWEDPRSTAGELLWPQRIDQVALASYKKSLGSYGYAGQFQQRPAPAGGGIFNAWWWRYWKPKYMDLPPVHVRMPDGKLVNIHPVNLPEDFDQEIQSWDMAFKDLAGNDYVAGGIWATKRADRFLMDQVRERLGFPETLDAVERISKKWPKARLKLVEDKANGPAVIQSLRHKVPGLVAVNPAGGKIARAQACSPEVESGNVYLPHPAIAPWVEGFIAECSSFPNGAHDDQVDQMTQALLRLGAPPLTKSTLPPPSMPSGPRSWMV